MKKKILVIIPCYNCQEQVPRVLKKFNHNIQEHLDTILILNNQSTDNTESAAIEHINELSHMNALIFKNELNYGYGGSLKIGFEFAIHHDFDWVIILNGDDQSPIDDFLPLLTSLEYEKNDVMWGCRFLKKSTLNNYSLPRTFANHVFNILFSLTIKKPVHDIGCGVYMYSTKILKERFYATVPDVLYIGSFLRLIHDYYQHKLSEFPVQWNTLDQHSTVKVFSQTLAHFKMVWQYKRNKQRFISNKFKKIRADQYITQLVYSNHPGKLGLNSQDKFIVTF